MTIRHDVSQVERSKRDIPRLTCIDFSTNDQFCFTYSCPNNRTILSLVVDHFVRATFNFLTGRCVPDITDDGEGLELVSCRRRKCPQSLFIRYLKAKDLEDLPQYAIISCDGIPGGIRWFR